MTQSNERESLECRDTSETIKRKVTIVLKKNRQSVQNTNEAVKLEWIQSARDINETIKLDNPQRTRDVNETIKLQTILSVREILTKQSK